MAFEEREVRTVLEDVAGCAASGDSEPLNALMTELELMVLEALSPVEFSAIQELLRSDAFLGLADSWLVVRFLDNNWEALSAIQREEIRPLLVDVYDKHADWMGAFVISEILGRRYGDQASLQTLARFGESARLPARALVTLGLEILAKEATDEALRGAAAEQLRALSQSDIEEVRDEASEALARVIHSRGHTD